MAKPGTISKGEAIEQIAAQVDRPISLNDFADRVLAIWPSKAKNPRGSVRQSIRSDHLGKDVLFLDETTLLPTRLGMSGVRFRVPLSRQEVEKGWLFALPSFQLLYKHNLQHEDFRFEDVKGNPIPANPVSVKYKKRTIFGISDFEGTAFDLGWWYKKHNIRRKDSLLVTIINWETGHFRLRPEPAREYKKHLGEIKERNQVLADLLYDTLESARNESVWGSVAIPTTYFRLKDPNAYPADHWMEILEKDPRMTWTGYEIRYADWQSPLERIFAEREQKPRIKPKPLPKKQARQVYRFKASFWYQKSLWRRIEIQGRQTLFEFDDILRSAFSHDHFDHLSGFWKLVRRGSSRQFREVDLGSIIPYEGGDAADVRIADLDMEPGQALKYVYDFGDWIQHRIELEAIDEPEPEADYPRIVAQNKPRYRDCIYCKEKGKKTVGTWVCLTCSNQEQGDILLCEDCLDSHYEDHYVEKMIY